MPNGQPTAPIDAAIAMTYMLLKAAELGIGSCWIGNFSQQKMKSLLCVPDMAEVIAVSPAGLSGGGGQRARAQAVRRGRLLRPLPRLTKNREFRD